MITRIITLLTALIVCGTVIFSTIVWKTGKIPFAAEPPAAAVLTPAQVIDQENLEYLTAIIWHSFGSQNDPKAKLLAGIAARNTARILDRNYKAIFEGALEMVPLGSTKQFGYTRWLSYVKAQASHGEWLAARQVALLILSDADNKLAATLQPTEACVTTFQRTGRADPTKAEDRRRVTEFRPRAYETPDGSFFLCMTLTR